MTDFRILCRYKEPCDVVNGISFFQDGERRGKAIIQQKIIENGKEIWEDLPVVFEGLK